MNRWRAPTMLLIAMSLLAGCENAMHDMYDQPKIKPGQASRLFEGRSGQPPPPGSVALASGALADTSSGRRGHLRAWPAPGGAIPRGEDGSPLASVSGTSADFSNPLALDAALLARGRQRYDIFCAPCHGRAGDGAGMVVQRGFPAPPSYHDARLRNAPDSHFYQVISHGYGVMYPYADRVNPHDRWAIVAYIRALQLSQHAPRAMLEPRDLKRLGKPNARGAKLP